MSVKVYNLSGSPLGWRVFLGLDFKGLDHTAIYLNGQEREHRQEPFLARNPHGKVPVLGHGAVHMRESLAILGWLDQEFPAQPLFGSTASEIAANWMRAVKYSDYLLTATADVVAPVFGGVDGKPNLQNANTDLAHAATLLKVELAEIEADLADSPFLCGAEPGAADAVAFPDIGRVMRALDTRPQSMNDLGFGTLDADFPKLAAWRDRVIARPGHAHTTPPHWSASQAIKDQP